MLPPHGVWVTEATSVADASHMLRNVRATVVSRDREWLSAHDLLLSVVPEMWILCNPRECLSSIRRRGSGANCVEN